MVYSIADMIQQRLLNTTDQVDESRFSPDLAAALLNDCKITINRITTVLSFSSRHVEIKLLPIFSYAKVLMHRKMFFNVLLVYSIHLPYFI